MLSGRTHDTIRRAAEPTPRSGVATCPATTSHAVAVRSALTGRLQRKVTVGSEHDPAEHEANAVADRVMRSPESATAVEEEREDEEVQRQAVEEEREDEVQRVADAGGIDDGTLREEQLAESAPPEGTLQDAPAPTGEAPSTVDPTGGKAPSGPIGGEQLAVEAPSGLEATDVLDRAELTHVGEQDAQVTERDEPASATAEPGAGASGDEPDHAEATTSEASEEVIQRHTTGAGLDPHHRLDLDALRTPSGGEPVPEVIRRRVEPALGVDLSAVRVHRGSEAARRAERLGARAFTLGRHVWLGRGASITDTRLMTHELTHVVQQRAVPYRPRGPPQRHTTRTTPVRRVQSPPSAPPIAVAHEAPRPVVRRGLFSDAADWVGGKISDAAGWVKGKVEDVLDYAKEKIAEFADGLPGYRVLAFVLGKEPITDRTVSRTGGNLIWALRPILPDRILDQLAQSGAADEVVEDVGTAISGLVRAIGSIPTLLSRTWDAISIRVSLSENWRRVKAVWTPLFRKVRRFVVTIGRAILRFVLKAALTAAGSLGSQVWEVLAQVGAVIGLIAAHPVRFLTNLIRAVVGGFKGFLHRITTHLKAGFVAWLTGTLAEAGIEMPSRFNLAGIIRLGLQLIGLTWANIRRRLVRQLKPNGERKVALLEKAVEVVRLVVTKGLRAIIPMITRRLSGLLDTVRSAIMQFIAIALAKEAARWVGGLFSGGVGAIIQLAIKIYHVVAWVIENFTRMLSIVSSVASSVGNIARGRVAAAAEAVEGTLANLVAPLIALFARLVGLGGLPGKIRRLVKRLSAPVNRAIDTVVKFALKLGRRFLTKVTSAARKATAWFRRKLPFGRGKQRHNLVFKGSPKAPELYVRSTPAKFRTWLDAQFPADGSAPPQTEELRTEAKAKHTELEAALAAASKKKNDDGKDVTRKLEALKIALEAFTAYLEATSNTPLSTVEYGPTRSIDVPGGPSPVATRMTASPLTAAGPSGSGVRNDSALWQVLRRRPEGGRTFWVQGHMLNSNVHGPGTDPQNLTPISQSANQQHERQVESKVKDTVLTPIGRGDSRIWPVIHYEVEANYVGRRKLPADAEAAPTETQETLQAEAQLTAGLTCNAFHMRLQNGAWSKDASQPIVQSITILNDPPMTVFDAQAREPAAAPWYLAHDDGTRIRAALAATPWADDASVIAAVHHAVAPDNVRTWAAFEARLTEQLTTVEQEGRASAVMQITAALRNAGRVHLRPR